MFENNSFRKKKKYYKTSDKDCLRPLSMPNKKLILSKFDKEIDERGKEFLCKLIEAAAP